MCQQRPFNIDASLNLSKDARERLLFVLGSEIHHFVQLLVSSWIQRGRIGIEIRSFNCHGPISENRLERLLARRAGAALASSFTTDRCRSGNHRWCNINVQGSDRLRPTEMLVFFFVRPLLLMLSANNSPTALHR